MTPQQLRQRTYDFALRNLRLFKQLPKTEEARVVGRQLLRASSGVAANYRACCRGRTRREFAAKLGTVLEESDECILWLRLMIDGDIRRDTEVQSLLQEAMELTAIFTASWRTVKRQQRNREASTPKGKKGPRVYEHQVSDL